jgi:hypothetical protein
MGCEVCGHVFAESHRIKPGLWGGTYEDPGNVVPLCPNHHAAIHFVMEWYMRGKGRTEAEDQRILEYMADRDFWNFWLIEVKAVVVEHEIATGQRIGKAYRNPLARYTRPSALVSRPAAYPDPGRQRTNPRAGHPPGARGGRAVDADRGEYRTCRWRRIMSTTGIPTVYRGRQYRSRLEARWAAFFDLLGWSYEYEPFDLQGWIPDFLLTRARVLVEVKPVAIWPRDVMEEIDDCRGADEYEVLVAGCSVPVDIHPRVEAEVGLAIGWLRTTPPSWNADMPKTWCGAMVQGFLERFFSQDDPSGFEYRSVGIGLYGSRDHILRADPGYTPPDEDLGSFAFNRIYPCTELTPWAVYTPELDSSETGGRPIPESNLIRNLWTKAGNMTQWKGRQSVVS